MNDNHPDLFRTRNGQGVDRKVEISSGMIGVSTYGVISVLVDICVLALGKIGAFGSISARACLASLWQTGLIILPFAPGVETPGYNIGRPLPRTGSGCLIG